MVRVVSPQQSNIARLSNILNAWQARESLPHICAFEQLFEDITPSQSDWLTRFNAAWDRWAN